MVDPTENASMRPRHYCRGDARFVRTVAPDLELLQ